MQLNAIDRLAELTETSWAEANYDEQAFPEIAATALEQVAAHRSLSSAQLVGAVLARDGRRSLRTHSAANVVTLYSSPRFDILAHLWVDGLATPHQHGWAGAYQVIEGSSVRCHFELEEPRRVRANFHLGVLRAHNLGYLTAGAVVAVPAGSGLIHALSHVERPSLSISVRTPEPTALTLDYLRPGLAYQVGGIDATTQDRLKCVDMLMLTDDHTWITALEVLVSEHDLVTAFFALQGAAMSPRPIPASVLASGRERHGPAFDVIEASLADIARTMLFQNLRHSIVDPDLRFFLGGLYLARSRGELVELIARRHPGAAPGPLMGTWLARLLIERDDGAESGVPEPVARALGELAMGLDLQAALERLRAATDAGERDAHSEFVCEAHTALVEAPVYGPLFAAASPS